MVWAALLDHDNRANDLTVFSVSKAADGNSGNKGMLQQLLNLGWKSNREAIEGLTQPLTRSISRADILCPPHLIMSCADTKKFKHLDMACRSSVNQPCWPSREF
jgi:hypothetical protein